MYKIMNIIIFLTYISIFLLTNFFVNSFSIHKLNKLNKLNRFGELNELNNNNMNINDFIENNKDCLNWSKIKFNDKIIPYYNFKIYNYEFLDMAHNIENIRDTSTIRNHMKLLILDINMMNNIIELLERKKRLYFNNGEIVQLLDNIIDNENECLNNIKKLFGTYLDKKKLL